LLGVLVFYPIRLGQRDGGNESQLSDGTYTDVAGYLRRRRCCSSLVEYKGLYGLGGVGVCGGSWLEFSVHGWKGQKAVCNWVDWDEKSLIFS